MNPKVTIILPVYNAEKYIHDTLQSVLNQSYQNLEVICVDDGSKDHSVAIMREFAANDKRIVILQQKNQFAGIARNNGLAHATGKYVMFLDSDDLFEKNMVSYLVSKAETHNTDLIVYGYWRFIDTVKKRRPVRNKYKSGMLCSAEDIKANILQITRSLPWDKFLRMDFVKKTGILFHGTRVNNDIYFNRTIVTEAKKILFVGKRFVNYKIDNAMSLQGHLNKNCTDFLVGNRLIFERLSERGTLSTFRNSFELMILDDIVMHLLKINSYVEFKEIINKMIDENFMESMGITPQSATLLEHPYRNLFEKIFEDNMQEAFYSLFATLRDTSVVKGSAEYLIGHKIMKMARMTLE